MAHWPLPTGVVRQLSTIRAASGNMTGITVTASATPHTKGAWTEIIAVTSGDVRVLSLYGSIVVATAATDTAMLLDIGIGAAASETVVLADYNVGAFQLLFGSMFLVLPLAIPAGSRIAARIQAKVISDTFGLGIDTYGSSGLSGCPVSGVAVDTYGTDAANSRGTAVVTGGANTFGAWTQIVASTTNPLRAAWLSAGQGGDTVTNHPWGFELGVGGAGVEQTLVNIGGNINASEAMESKNPSAAPGLFATPIPTGQRLSVRAKSSSATKTFDVSVYGLR